MAATVLFSSINVTTQVFFRTAGSYGLVNLKPIVRGHVLVIPKRVVPRLSDLQPDEVAELFKSVQRVGNIVQDAYGAEALTVACQDGSAAGQSVPHVHVHILPRRFKGDVFEDNPDAVYPLLEKAGRAMKEDYREPEEIKMDADEQRLPRTMAEMETEARWLASLFTLEEQPSQEGFRY
ncbi:diadenosine 5',5'''-P1,P4-tetraphosphate asymmetrical hydrolase [Auriculariales sp. MPI-PUGE-AT-0066]|nr:diadenosine 5',5'''-P1,P4-tetraphosphate asymmetrical hydrolase [Auriculariales sp. MPI-PUGE-AT-0066]